MLSDSDWKHNYVDPMIFDGTPWSLELTLIRGCHYNISGSNDFPALYKDLIRTFKPYMTKPKERCVLRKTWYLCII